MAKKVVNKPVVKKKTAKEDNDFRAEFKAELLKVSKDMTEEAVDIFLDKAPVGKAALKAYAKLHG